jgi:non-specific serine/threonine protein kinase
MVISIKAGGYGLNLTAANHVIHFDRWWNPAVENQATDRVFRIGQKKNVLVHKFITKGTLEEKIDTLLEAKGKLSSEIIQSSNEQWITEMDNDKLMNLLTLSL